MPALKIKLSENQVLTIMEIKTAYYFNRNNRCLNSTTVKREMIRIIYYIGKKSCLPI